MLLEMTFCRSTPETTDLKGLCLSPLSRANPAQKLELQNELCEPAAEKGLSIFQSLRIGRVFPANSCRDSLKLSRERYLSGYPYELPF